MWLPDRGVAAHASWRIARLLSIRHPHIRVGWRPGPDGVEYDPMTIRGRGAQGAFEVLINRTGTIRVHVTELVVNAGREDDEDDEYVEETTETLVLGWDDIIHREMTDAPGLPGFERTVLAIERAAGLVGPPWEEMHDLSEAAETTPSPSLFATTVLGVISSVHAALDRPAMTETVEVMSIEREAQWGTHWRFERNPSILDDARSRSSDDEDDQQVWVVRVFREGSDDLVIDPTGPRAWVEGLDRPVDLIALGAREDGAGPDSVRAAMRLLGPTSELAAFTVPAAGPGAAGVPAGTELTYGVLETSDASEDRVATLGGRVEHDAATGDGAGEGSGRWRIVVRPLVGPERSLVTDHAPRVGREPGVVRFSVDGRPMRHRPLEPWDARWISRYDVGLDVHDLRKLLDIIEGLRDAVDPTGPGCWEELAQQREAVEELVALALPDKGTVFGLHYLLLDGRRVVNPLFRGGGEWDDGLPPADTRWEEAAFHLAVAEGTLRSIDEFDASEDPFALLGAADYLPIHPTMASAFLQIFDRGHRVPVELARLAEGHADDTVDGERFPVPGADGVPIVIRGLTRRIMLLTELGEALRP